MQIQPFTSSNFGKVGGGAAGRMMQLIETLEFWRTTALNRRLFVKRLGAGFIAGSSRLGSSQDLPTPTVYFVDGYHGGAKGHMPPGSWRDILDAMQIYPNWKLCLDIEPESWEVLRREDPQAYREWKAYLDHQPIDARVEMVAGTYSQPYGWAVGGESNIRQLQIGLRIIREHFPKARVETYAVQEPCWASCLPQILLSLGYTGAVLKDPGTAWGGYAAGMDAETVRWVGPDGSAITTVPRYACENLQKVYETEAADAKPTYARKCVEHGIPHPTGMYFQDLGWAAKPKAAGSYIRNVTWREYIHTIANKPARNWRFGIEDILTALPWGEKTLQTVAQQVRSAENKILVAEKAAAMAWLRESKYWPIEQLEQAWEDVLWAQSHDSWITATTRTGRQAWAFQIASGTLNCETIANNVINSSVLTLCGGHADRPVQQRVGSQWVRVVNTLAEVRTDLAEITLDTDHGARGVRVLDSDGAEVASQLIITRRFREPASGGPQGPETERALAPGESINSARVMFTARTPSLGYASYRVEPIYGQESVRPLSGTRAAVEDGLVIIESDLYRIRIDPARGGAITSLVDKQTQKEFCDPSSVRLFNEYYGYFIAQQKWRSSAETGARVNIIEYGPIRAQVHIAGEVGDCPFQCNISVVQGCRRIDFQTRFIFAEDTWIGDPWDIKPENRRSEPRRSSNDGRWKLNAFFPTTLRNQAIFKNAAYDVCRSRNVDTFFQRWDEIKHNIITNWVDIYDELEDFGLAVMSDHSTGYTHGPTFPLALVMGWGGEGGFWWGKCPLRGVQQTSYGIIPHKGNWSNARLLTETSRWNEPLLTQIMEQEPASHDAQRSMVRITGGAVEVPTLLIEKNNLLIRLFNGEGENSRRTVSLDARISRAELIELDGRVIRSLSIRNRAGRYEFDIDLVRFGLMTIHCTLAI